MVVGLASGARAHEGHETGPHPTPTAAASAQGAAAPLPTSVLFRVRPDARADLGWTGSAHGQGWPAEQRIGFGLDCGAGDGSCKAIGGARGDAFGAPIPLSSGGVPACVVNRLRTSVSGDVQPAAGCGTLALYLTSTIALGEDVARPCPTCRDDTAPNDGKREGQCVGGASAGKPCDAQSASALFGATSMDCLPTGNVGDLTIDLAPLTTGESKLEPTLMCKIGGKKGPRCYCAAQVQADACLNDAPCAANGQCPDGPIDGTCSRTPYRGCRPGTGRTDCEDLFPDSGECVIATRPCFRDAITVQGACDPERPTYAAVFCVPQTGATALNSVAGLPGPARIVLPLERVR